VAEFDSTIAPMNNSISTPSLAVQSTPSSSMTSAARPTIYQTLPNNTNRPLFIYPGQYPEPNRCVLQSFALDLPLSYIALSYVWAFRKRTVLSLATNMNSESRQASIIPSRVCGSQVLFTYYGRMLSASINPTTRSAHSRLN